ncbi:MAG: fluoride efflux transporter FluC [Acidimicrobiales bacterium]
MITVLLFAAAAATGSLARTGLAARLRTAAGFPLGTVLVNLAGSLALGWATGAGWSGPTRTIVAAAGLGSFTTFSSFANDAAGLWRSGRRRAAGAYVAVSVAGAVAAAELGLLLTS